MTAAPTLDSASVVRAFFAAMEDRATDQAIALADPKIVWRNTSLPTVRGRMVARILRSMDVDWMRFRADFHRIAADGSVVLTERTDYLRIGPIEADFWVCGTFEVRDGRITLWHDYFSWGSVLRGTVKGLLKAVFRRRTA